MIPELRQLFVDAVMPSLMSLEVAIVITNGQDKVKHFYPFGRERAHTKTTCTSDPIIKKALAETIQDLRVVFHVWPGLVVHNTSAFLSLFQVERNKIQISTVGCERDVSLQG
jgi:hypothetical protein